MKIHLLNMLRTQWTDRVVDAWSASGEYNLQSAPGACHDCGHPTAFVKGCGNAMCSACMIINAKFPYGEGAKTTQLVNGKSVGGIGLLALPDREEIHLWINQSLQNHVAVLEIKSDSGIVVHPTGNKTAIDISTFIGDLALLHFFPDEVYWAGVCQDNDSHKVSQMLKNATPKIWSDVLFIRKSVMKVVYLQPKTMKALRVMAGNAYWKDFIGEVLSYARILGALEQFEENIMAQIDGAESTGKKASLLASMEKERLRVEKLLLTYIGKEIEASDKSRQSFGHFINSSLGPLYNEDVALISDNLLSVWS